MKFSSCLGIKLTHICKCTDSNTYTQVNLTNSMSTIFFQFFCYATKCFSKHVCWFSKGTKAELTDSFDWLPFLPLTYTHHVYSKRYQLVNQLFQLLPIQQTIKHKLPIQFSFEILDGSFAAVSVLLMQYQLYLEYSFK